MKKVSAIMGRPKGSKNRTRNGIPIRKIQQEPESELRHLQESFSDEELEESNLPVFDARVLKAYREKNYEKCVKLIDRILVINTDDNKDHYKILQAAAHTMIGEDFKAAHSLLDEVLLSDTSNAFAVYGKGVALYFEKKFDESVAMFDRAIEMKPQEMERAKDMKIRIDLERRKAVIRIRKMTNDTDVEMPENFEKFVEDIDEAKHGKKFKDDKLPTDSIDNTAHQSKISDKFVEVKPENGSKLIHSRKSRPTVRIESERDPLKIDDDTPSRLQANTIAVRRTIVKITPENLLERAKKLYLNGSLQTALKLIVKVLDVNSDLTEAEELESNIQEFIDLKGLADKNMESKNYEIVVQICSEALKIDPGNDIVNKSFFYQRGLAQVNLGNTNESMKDYAEYDRLSKLTTK